MKEIGGFEFSFSHAASLTCLRLKRFETHACKILCGYACRIIFSEVTDLLIGISLRPSSLGIPIRFLVGTFLDLGM